MNDDIYIYMCVCVHNYIYIYILPSIRSSLLFNLSIGYRLALSQGGLG